MKLQIASDLHLELPQNRVYIKEHLFNNSLINPVGDILVLAGDIAYLDSKNAGHENFKWFWDWCADNFEETIVIPGNHEFYDSYDVATLPDGYTKELRPNVHIYYNNVVKVGNTDLILSTLWGEIPQIYEKYTEQAVSDFYRICYNGHKLRAVDFTELFKHCFDFVEREVAESDAHHKVVVTHHLPSLVVMSQEFIGSNINGAFVTELCDYINNSNIDYWVFGHSHRNIDREIGNTKLVSNQLGYVSYREHGSFNPEKVIEL